MSTSTVLFANTFLTLLRAQGLAASKARSIHRVHGLLHSGLQPPEFKRDHAIETLEQASGVQVGNVEKLTCNAPAGNVAASIGFRCGVAMRIGFSLWGEHADSAMNEVLAPITSEVRNALIIEIDRYIAVQWRDRLQEILPYLQDPTGQMGVRVDQFGGTAMVGYPLACAVRHMQAAMLLLACSAIRNDEPRMARIEHLISLLVQRPIIGRDLTNPGTVLFLA